jgi:hypothetical protein
MVKVEDEPHADHETRIRRVERWTSMMTGPCSATESEDADAVVPRRDPHTGDTAPDADVAAPRSVPARSCETQGGVHNVDTEPWTPKQVGSLARIAAWCHDVHGIRLALMPDSRPQSTGVGPHRLGIDPWRVSGGERWSASYGRICPGAGKIAQIPRLIALAKRGGDELTEAQANRIIQLLEELTAQGRLMAVRMDSITNRQLPGLRADADRAADVIAGPDDSTP